MSPTICHSNDAINVLFERSEARSDVISIRHRRYVSDRRQYQVNTIQQGFVSKGEEGQLCGQRSYLVKGFVSNALVDIDRFIEPSIIFYST